MKAALFITEHQRLARAGKLYRQARKIPGVVDAFPCLGRYDGVVFIEARDSDALNDVVVRVSRLPGVYTTSLHTGERQRAISPY